jgi:hypothetical protein
MAVKENLSLLAAAGETLQLRQLNSGKDEKCGE